MVVFDGVIHGGFQNFKKEGLPEHDGGGG